MIDGDVTDTATLDRMATEGALGLAAQGLAPGDRVGVVLPACVAALEVWFSTARAGLVEVPLNPGAGAGLLQYYLRHARVRAVIFSAETEETVRAATAAVGTVDHLIRVEDDWPRLREAGLVGGAPALPEVDPDSASVILYTSGTTGPPKGVLLSHRANVNLSRHTVDLMAYGPEDRLYSVFPLYHSNARYCSVMAAIESGADLLMHRRFSATHFWQICREERITAFNYQGAMTSILHKQALRADDADNPVRAAFGAPCPAEIFADFEQRFGLQLTEIYGSTEVSIVCDMPPSRRRIGTAGMESANYHVRVVDEADEEVAAGTPGEIVVRPKSPGWMFLGYDGRPDATVESWRNLWFHTGDRGMMDADGYLTFLDRQKDTVRRRGENVSTWEIERTFAADDEVAEVAAYGVPAELSEEEVMIAVVPAAGVDLDPAALLARCDPALTGFARPRFVRLVGELPKTPSQRVEKYRLRTDGVTADTWDREAQ